MIKFQALHRGPTSAIMKNVALLYLSVVCYFNHLLIFPAHSVYINANKCTGTMKSLIIPEDIYLQIYELQGDVN